jgi:hypothetical protein
MTPPLHTPATARPTFGARRGVTLLEVLMAMGVMVVGLLGLASLIPLGRLELAEGERLDNSSTLGRMAFRDVTVRGYARPELWADPVTGQTVIAENITAGVSSTISFQFSQNDILAPPYAPIVVDPLMIAPTFFGEATNDTTVPTGSESTHRTNCRSFPYVRNLPNPTGPEATIPRIARVTLRSYPTNVLSGSVGMTMRYDVASRYFRSTDDLIVKIPTDKAQQPVQVFTPSGITNLSLTADNGITTEIDPITNAAVRQSRGDYTWFFIVEPSLAQCRSNADKMPIMGGPAASPSLMTQFRVWVVVCYKRDLRETSAMNLNASREIGERCVWVDFIDRNSARLRVEGIFDEKSAFEALNVRANQWIAVVARCRNPLLDPNPSESNSQNQYTLEWYRIVNVGDAPVPHETQDGRWYREVVLTGRDFLDPAMSPSGSGFEDTDPTANPYTDLTGLIDPAGLGRQMPISTWGVLVTGVRGVYEKSVFVDRPSLWAERF